MFPSDAEAEDLSTTPDEGVMLDADLQGAYNAVKALSRVTNKFRASELMYCHRISVYMHLCF